MANKVESILEEIKGLTLLEAADLVIADASKPLAVAGVIGGQESSVQDSTTRAFLECARFKPASVSDSNGSFPVSKQYSVAPSE